VPISGDSPTWLTVLRVSSSTITRACAVDGFTSRSLSDRFPALFQPPQECSRCRPAQRGKRPRRRGTGGERPVRDARGRHAWSGGRSHRPCAGASRLWASPTTFGRFALLSPRVCVPAREGSRTPGEFHHAIPDPRARVAVAESGRAHNLPTAVAESPHAAPTTCRRPERADGRDATGRLGRRPSPANHLSGTRSTCPVPSGELPSAGHTLQLEM